VIVSPFLRFDVLLLSIMYSVDKNLVQKATTISAGVISFGTVNALSCWIQGSILGVSTGTLAPIPSLFGLVTISVASYISHSSAICIDHFQQERRRQRKKSIQDAVKYAWNHRPSIADKKSFYSDNSIFGPNEPNPYLHTLRLCVFGLLCFKLLGGRFWSVAPSSYTHIGAFARKSIAATDQYATPMQRQTIQRLGRIYGCHTCGAKPFPFLPSSATMNFIGDHQPPKTVAYQMNQQWLRRLFGWKVPFRFYPHCLLCSNKQGGILASATLDVAKAQSLNRWFKNISSLNGKIPSLKAAGGGYNAYIHALKPRLHYLTGGVIAAVATADSDQGRQRYIDMHSHLNRIFDPPLQRLEKLNRTLRHRNKLVQRASNKFKKQFRHLRHNHFSYKWHNDFLHK
jgi:hypothetical protein